MQKKGRWVVSIIAGALVVLASLSPVLADDKESCVKPAKGPIGTAPPQKASGWGMASSEHAALRARVGETAPDFEANAFVDGQFKNITLSDYRGRWVVLCFYPGDFTFV